MAPEEFLNGPSLDGQFPITFHNGFQVSTLGFWCRACNKIAPLDRVHGHMTLFCLETLIVWFHSTMTSCSSAESLSNENWLARKKSTTDTRTDRYTMVNARGFSRKSYKDSHLLTESADISGWNLFTLCVSSLPSG